MTKIIKPVAVVTLASNEASIDLFTGAMNNAVLAEECFAQLKSLKLDYSQYKAIRAGVLAGYIGVKSGFDMAWSRACKKAGFTAPKSTSTAAVKKAESRAGVKVPQVITSGDADEGDPSNPAIVPVMGKSKGEKLPALMSFELDSFEANLVGWYRAKNWSMIEAFIKAKSAA
jgi:hypothetical protein